MIAAAVLARARAAGLTLAAAGDRLRWRGPPPSAELLAELRRHKTALLGLVLANDPARVLLSARSEQAEAERQDREAVAAETPPVATLPVEAATRAEWEAELAKLLAADPAQRITDPGHAASYFAAEARRRLARVAHDEQAAGLLIGFWRRSRGRAA